MSPFAFNPASRTVTFRFASALPDGQYQATLAASAVADPAGQHLDGNGDGTGGDDYTFNFFVLAGDVNRDRRVDFGDLLLVAQHYGQSGTFAEGDLNGDDKVGFDDLLLLAQDYNKVLAAELLAALRFW